MKRIFFITTAVFAIAAMVLTAAVAAAAGGKTYDLRDLQGEWYVVVSEIRYESMPGFPSPVVYYCSGSGTSVTDGMGAGTTQGVSRCIVPGMDPVITTSAGSFTYTVSPDGAVLVTGEGETEPTHCQIVDKGKTLLCGPMGRGSYILHWESTTVKK